ncbi:MAG: cytochrome c biogenesis protein CcdA [Vicinamibacterales bacterium]
MAAHVVAFIGGALAIASPCILPVLPYVFAGAGRSFRRNTLPMLAGMALTFASVGTGAAVAGGWVVAANQRGRDVALAIFTLVGVALLSPRVAEALAQPWRRWSTFLWIRGQARGTVAGSVVFGISCGVLWAPCAGPILGILLTQVALDGPSLSSALLLLSFGSGAASTLVAVLVAGGRAVRVLRFWRAADRWARPALGVSVLAAVAAGWAGLDTGLLAQLSLTRFGTATGLELRLADRAWPPDTTTGGAAAGTAPRSGHRGDDLMPPLDGAVAWLNGGPYTPAQLKGRVVAVNFWTYTCINCLRAIPYFEAWARAYGATGLTVIGAHTPEFAFERDPANVERAVRGLGLSYPIAVDSRRDLWTAFGNSYWPATYLIDADGRVRYRHFGEGHYDLIEREIRELLNERDVRRLHADVAAHVLPSGVLAPAELSELESPETYLGYARQALFRSPEPLRRDVPGRYTLPADPARDEWGLDGRWVVGAEHVTLASTPGRIAFRFRARDLHLVLAPPLSGGAVRFRVSLDGAPPAASHGVDSDNQGLGVVTEPRLYQLIRQRTVVSDRTFAIEFLDAGIRAFVFTFG